MFEQTDLSFRKPLIGQSIRRPGHTRSKFGARGSFRRCLPRFAKIERNPPREVARGSLARAIKGSRRVHRRPFLRARGKGESKSHQIPAKGPEFA